MLDALTATLTATASALLSTPRPSPGQHLTQPVRGLTVDPLGDVAVQVAGQCRRRVPYELGHDPDGDTWNPDWI